MELKFDLIQTMGIATLFYLLGSFIKSKVSFFQKYFIPAAVIGGIVCSLLIFAGVQTNTFTVSFTTPLQDFFMNLFFTCTGFTCSISIIKKSGKQGAILAVGAVFFLIVQNLVGVGLCSVFGLNKLYGVAMGSISMSGGVGSGASFGPTLEALGAVGATTIGVSAATFGLLMGSLVGGPVAERLIKKYNLKSTVKEGNKDVKNVIELSNKRIFNSVLLILLAAAVGSYLGKLINLTGLNFPYYVGCLFAGMIFRNVADAKGITLTMEEIDIVGNVSLNLFIAQALMSLNISKLVDLAGPMLAVLATQTVVMMLWAYFITFRSMGKDYDAAVMAAGHCGVGLGQTSNAIANMATIIEKNGPAPNAWFVLPVITVVFINICNPVVITTFINLLG